MISSKNTMMLSEYPLKYPFQQPGRKRIIGQAAVFDKPPQAVDEANEMARCDRFVEIR